MNEWMNNRVSEWMFGRMDFSLEGKQRDGKSRPDLHNRKIKYACGVVYCHLWSVWVYHIYPHYLTKDKIFRKKKTKVVFHNNCVLILSKNFARNVSHSKKHSEICYHKCTYVCMSNIFYLFRFYSNLNFLNK